MSQPQSRAERRHGAHGTGNKPPTKRDPMTVVYICIAIAVVLIFAGFGFSKWNDYRQYSAAIATPTPGPNANAKQIQLADGATIGKPAFAIGNSADGGNGSPVDGIQCEATERVTLHVHAHLALFHKGQQIAIPYGIGIVKPFQVKDGFVGMGQGIYWLHTHDATGIIHVESPDDRTYTLANFFNIWGQPLTATNVAGLTGALRIFVDGKPYSGDPRKIVLGAHTQITLEVGAPFVPPPAYVFPNGL